MVTFTVLCTVAYYLFARAEITRWAWSRYPKWLDTLALCAACTGFWIGLGVSFYLPPPFVGGGATSAAGMVVERAAWGAAWGLVLTPLGAAVLLYALALTAVPPPPE